MGLRLWDCGGDAFHMFEIKDADDYKGDLNGDGQITVADVSREHNDAVDMGGDGRVTSSDALIVIQAAAGAIEL